MHSTYTSAAFTLTDASVAFGVEQGSITMCNDTYVESIRGDMSMPVYLAWYDTSLSRARNLAILEWSSDMWDAGHSFGNCAYHKFILRHMVARENRPLRKVYAFCVATEERGKLYSIQSSCGMTGVWDFPLELSLHLISREWVGASKGCWVDFSWDP
jgi:hypothetical protein